MNLMRLRSSSTDPVFAAAVARVSYWEGVLADARACNQQRHARQAVQMIDAYGQIVADMLATRQTP
jgi:hypothetical protein